MTYNVFGGTLSLTQSINHPRPNYAVSVCFSQTVTTRWSENSPPLSHCRWSKDVAVVGICSISLLLLHVSAGLAFRFMAPCVNDVTYWPVDNEDSRPRLVTDRRPSCLFTHVWTGFYACLMQLVQVLLSALWLLALPSCHCPHWHFYISFSYFWCRSHERQSKV